jgi:hypothetical protein
MNARRPTETAEQKQEISAEAEGLQPSAAQRRYLARGLVEPGGKLPLFDETGREVPKKTIEACIERGWAERWIANPVKPDWVVCKLTEAGYRALGAEPPCTRSEVPQRR